MRIMRTLALCAAAFIASPLPPKAAEGYKTRQIEGRTVPGSEKLPGERADENEKALKLTPAQLAEIVRVVPANAVAKLREVPLWFSPGYPGTRPKAEYDPGAGWLLEKHDPQMFEPLGALWGMPPN